MSNLYIFEYILSTLSYVYKNKKLIIIQVYRNLLELLDFDDIGMLYLEFVVTEDKMGVTETVELIGERFALYNSMAMDI
jgi:hypothetical protein